MLIKVDGPETSDANRTIGRCCERNRWPQASVSVGVVVGNTILSKSAGPVPTPQTNFVPPASIPPKRMPLKLV